MDCGPTCLRMVAKFHGREFSLDSLRSICHKGKTGVSFLSISRGVEEIGLRALGAKLTLDVLRKKAPLPSILYWRKEHFVVLYEINKRWAYIGDPAAGLRKLPIQDFLKFWIGTDQRPDSEGLVLLLEPTPEFKQQDVDDDIKTKTIWSYLPYLWIHKKMLFQIILGMIIGLGMNAITPFITQAVVDNGIQNRDIGFVTLVLIGQFMLFLGTTFSTMIQSLLGLHFTSRLNLSILSDYLIKLLKLPFSFFDSRSLGDIMQRMGDHGRIQQIISFQTLQTLFSFLNFFLYSFIILKYSLIVYGIFMTGSSLYVLWILLFLKKREQLDYKSFNQSAKDSNVFIQLIQGIREIKLNNCERQKRWQWERVQVRQFRISLQNFSLNQMQQVGSGFINRTKSLMITFIIAQSVIDGQMTLGMMMAIQYMLGQVAAPVSQFISFINSWQDAKIGVERLSEVYDCDDEEVPEDRRISEMPVHADITFDNVSFQYSGSKSPYILKNINLTIPQGKVTAIVGSSGSGKTTLLKLLLKFYQPQNGEIYIGQVPFQDLSHRVWRDHVGTVLQDSYIFSETIANNIALGDEDQINKKQLIYAARVANIYDYIESIPTKFNTMMGTDGRNLSQGQTQRMMIARAVYKNPDFLFFDEATNALDANNEKQIMENLDKFFEGRTVVVVAHRLSTVKNADQIIVLEQGEIVEQGTHEELLSNKGYYFNLVSNQLELQHA